MKILMICLSLFAFTGVTLASSLEIAKQSSSEKKSPDKKNVVPKVKRTVIG